MDWSPPGSCYHEILRQEYWSGLPFPSPGTLPHPGVKSTSPEMAGKIFIIAPPGKPTPELFMIILKLSV